MKLDYDLVRFLMIYLEESTDGERWLDAKLLPSLIHGAPANKIMYHYKYLVDKGMLQVSKHDRYMFLDLTPAGHEFLAATRKDTIWEKITRKIEPVGQVPIDLLIELGKLYIKAQLEGSLSGE